jgi:hypothetical protein
MNAVIKVEATRTRLFLVVVVIGVAFLAASLLEQLLRRGELPREDWPRWYSRFNHPMLYRSTADAPYSYVVLPQRMFLIGLANPAGGLRPSYSAKTRRTRSQRPSQSCRSYCARLDRVTIRRPDDRCGFVLDAFPWRLLLQPSHDV